jgi:uncharacterized protein YaaW (UPF0174 family)
VALDELRTVLELATDDELQQLTRILFCRKFNPLDYVNTPEPLDVQSQERVEWIESIEQRFRYLAADGLTVLQGRTQQVSYRQTIIQVCRYLKMPYSKQLSTEDLEAELFIHLMGKAYQQLPSAEQTAITTRIQKSLSQTKLDQPLPLHIQHDPLKLIVTGSSALVLSSVVQPIVLHQIARQFAIHLATYQVTQQAIVKGGMAVAGQIQTYITMHLARRGMVTAAATQGAVRGIFAFLGPAMWGWFFADLGWRAISTNYGRIIPTIMALAQIRLTRGTYLDVETYWEMA